MWRFVWRTGVLGWGFIMCAIFVGMQAAQRPSRILFILALNIPIWFCAGFLFGVLTWIHSEWSFKRYVARNPHWLSRPKGGLSVAI
jgi:hypothetical protein